MFWFDNIPSVSHIDLGISSCVEVKCMDCSSVRINVPVSVFKLPLFLGKAVSHYDTQS